MAKLWLTSSSKNTVDCVKICAAEKKNKYQIKSTKIILLYFYSNQGSVHSRDILKINHNKPNYFIFFGGLQ